MNRLCFFVAFNQNAGASLVSSSSSASIPFGLAERVPVCVCVRSDSITNHNARHKKSAKRKPLTLRHTHTGESAYFVLFCFFFHFLPTVYYYFWFYYAARFISIIDCWRAAVTTNSSQKEKKNTHRLCVCVCWEAAG